ncbi:MAG: Hpt domain-containing protein [Flavobacteriaceae bacterium]|nr:Hpt domain-containing protein [Flavobacteriaceae bacterium]
MEKPNLDYIKKLSGGDITFENQLIGVIKKEFPSELKTFLLNMTQERYPKAAENVHKLKHKFSILGLEKGYELADVFENNLKEGNPEKMSAFKRVLDQITAYLKTI